MQRTHRLPLHPTTTLTRTNIAVPVAIQSLVESRIIIEIRSKKGARSPAVVVMTASIATDTTARETHADAVMHKSKSLTSLRAYKSLSAQQRVETIKSNKS